ncbi:MAG: thiamine diphosphokinase [Dehalococcoidia bacterium]
MRALIVANGEPPSEALLRDLAAKASIVIAADGGADKALAAGVIPTVVVGDLDSVSPRTRATLDSRITHIDDADSTDLEKAVTLALDRGATAIDIVAAGGGRADHALANLSVLVRYGARAEIRIHDDLFAIRRVHHEARIVAAEGTVVSLVAIGRCTGVTTIGLRWPLRDATLDFSPLGVHNEVALRPAAVRVGTGDLLLFEGRWVEKHS